MQKMGDISQRVGVRLVKRLLRVGRPRAIAQKFGQPESQPRNGGLTAIFRRYLPFPITTAPVAEGISPAGMQLSWIDYNATLQQYIGIYEYSDVVADTHEDPILTVGTDRLSEWAMDVTEVITIDTLCGGTIVYYGGDGTTRATANGTISRGIVRKIVRGFERANASKITSVISPSQKVSTQGVEAGFFALCHTDLDSDIRGCQGFTAVVNYGNPDDAFPEEIGAVEKVRFLGSSLIKPWFAAATSVSSTAWLSNGNPPSAAASPDVYPVVFLAKDAFGVMRLQGRDSFELLVRNPKPEASDPAAQKGSIAVKWWYTAVILADPWIARAEVLCTANPD